MKKIRGVVLIVKACSSLRVVLAGTRNRRRWKLGKQVFEILLGGWRNTKSVLRTKVGGKGKYVKSKKSHRLLKCTRFQRIYLRWRRGRIVVGRQYPDKTRPGKYKNGRAFLSYAPSRKYRFLISYIYVSAGLRAHALVTIRECQFSFQQLKQLSMTRFEVLCGHFHPKS